LFGNQFDGTEFEYKVVSSSSRCCCTGFVCIDGEVRQAGEDVEDIEEVELFIAQGSFQEVKQGMLFKG